MGGVISSVVTDEVDDKLIAGSKSPCDAAELPGYNTVNPGEFFDDVTSNQTHGYIKMLLDPALANAYDFEGENPDGKPEMAVFMFHGNNGNAEEAVTTALAVLGRECLETLSEKYHVVLLCPVYPGYSDENGKRTAEHILRVCQHTCATLLLKGEFECALFIGHSMGTAVASGTINRVRKECAQREKETRVETLVLLAPFATVELLIKQYKPGLEGDFIEAFYNRDGDVEFANTDTVNEFLTTKPKTTEVFIVHAKDDQTIACEPNIAAIEEANTTNTKRLKIKLLEKGGHCFMFENTSETQKIVGQFLTERCTK